MNPEILNKLSAELDKPTGPAVDSKEFTEGMAELAKMKGNERAQKQHAKILEKIRGSLDKLGAKKDLQDNVSKALTEMRAAMPALPEKPKTPAQRLEEFTKKVTDPSSKIANEEMVEIQSYITKDELKDPKPLHNAIDARIAVLEKRSDLNAEETTTLTNLRSILTVLTVMEDNAKKKAEEEKQRVEKEKLEKEKRNADIWKGADAALAMTGNGALAAGISLGSAVPEVAANVRDAFTETRKLPLEKQMTIGLPVVLAAVAVGIAQWLIQKKNSYYVDKIDKESGRIKTLKVEPWISKFIRYSGMGIAAVALLNFAGKYARMENIKDAEREVLNGLDSISPDDQRLNDVELVGLKPALKFTVEGKDATAKFERGTYTETVEGTPVERKDEPLILVNNAPYSMRVDGKIVGNLMSSAKREKIDGKTYLKLAPNPFGTPEAYIAATDFEAVVVKGLNDKPATKKLVLPVSTAKGADNKLEEAKPFGIDFVKVETVAKAA